MSITSVRLQPDVEQGLEAVADKLKRSKSWVINEAIKEFVEKQRVEQQRWQETLSALESIEKGRTVSGDAVHSWLKSWGTLEEGTPPKAGS